MKIRYKLVTSEEDLTSEEKNYGSYEIEQMLENEYYFNNILIKYIDNKIEHIWSDRMEPEDATFIRDLSWVIKELNNLAGIIKE